MHDALGDRVKVWTTLNEPWCSSFLSYTAGLHAPGHYSVSEGLLAAHHLLLGHGKAVEALRARDASLDLGITLNFTVAEPADPTDPADVDAARRLDGQHNRWFLDPVFLGAYPADIVEDIRAVDADAVAALEAAILPGDLETIATRIDALGVNYYHGDLVGGRPPADPPQGGDAPTDREGRSPFPSFEGIHNYERGLPRTGMNWEVEPSGLTRLLTRDLHGVRGSRGHGPLRDRERRRRTTMSAVVEDGVVRVHDEDRVEFLRGHLGADPRRGRRRRRCAGLLLLVDARQLRVGMGLREALRHRPRRLRNARTLGQRQRTGIRSDHRRAGAGLTSGFRGRIAARGSR